MKETIIAALKGLDPRNNDHWTAEGLPSLKAIGIEGVKRADVSSAAPHFTRDNPIVDTPADVAEKTREQELEEAAAKAKAQLGTIAEQKARLELIVQQRSKDLEDARKAYMAAVEDLDGLLRAEEAAGRSRKPIHDILEFVKSQREHREARAKARQGG